MSKIDPNSILEMIWDMHYDEAYSGMSKLMAYECFRLIKSTEKNLADSEVTSIFQSAFLDFCNKVTSGNYTHINNNKFTNYFKTACVNQAHNFKREEKMPRQLFSDKNMSFHMEEITEAANEESEILSKKYLNRYGIIIQSHYINPNDKLLKEVSRVFHTMKDSCKFLIIMKFSLNLSHKEISKVLFPFYKFKSEDVCKTTLYRCLTSMRKQAKYVVS